MDVVHQECNRGNRIRVDVLPFVLALLPQLLVELHEQERLVLHVREQVIFTNEVKDVRAAQAQEVRESLAWLSIECVAEEVTKVSDMLQYGVNTGRTALRDTP